MILSSGGAWEEKSKEELCCSVLNVSFHKTFKTELEGLQNRKNCSLKVKEEIKNVENSFINKEEHSCSVLIRDYIKK